MQCSVGVSCTEKCFATKHLNPRAHLAPFVYYSLWWHTILLQSALKTPQLKILIPSHCMQNKPFQKVWSACNTTPGKTLEIDQDSWNSYVYVNWWSTIEMHGNSLRVFISFWMITKRRVLCMPYQQRAGSSKPSWKRRWKSRKDYRFIKSRKKQDSFVPVQCHSQNVHVGNDMPSTVRRWLKASHS